MKTLTLIFAALVSMAGLVATNQGANPKTLKKQDGGVTDENPVHSFPRIIDDVFIQEGEFLGSE